MMTVSRYLQSKKRMVFKAYKKAGIHGELFTYRILLTLHLAVSLPVRGVRSMKCYIS